MALTIEHIRNEYVDKERSFKDIAEELGTYPNKIRRFAIKHGIKPRDASQAQKLALEHGRHTHPTKDRPRTTRVKEQISASMAKVWQEMPQSERDRRVELSKEQWENTPLEKRQEVQQLAIEAIRKTAKEGSQLEKFLADKLWREGIDYEMHKQDLIIDGLVHVDIFLPGRGVAIEVNGLSHYKAIWGLANFQRNQKADRRKKGLLTKAGFCLIIIKCLHKNVSLATKNNAWILLKEELLRLEEEFPQTADKLVIELEV